MLTSSAHGPPLPMPIIFNPPSPPAPMSDMSEHEDADVDFPPSISQRHPTKRRARARHVKEIDLRSMEARSLHGPSKERSRTGTRPVTGMVVEKAECGHVRRAKPRGRADERLERDTLPGDRQMVKPKEEHKPRSRTTRPVHGTPLADSPDRPSFRSPASSIKTSKASPKPILHTTYSPTDDANPGRTLAIPIQHESRTVKAKRSLERTRAWAKDLDTYEKMDEGAPSLTSDDTSHGSESLLTPRSPSPAASTRLVIPTINAPGPLPADPPSPPRVLSIDELVRLHAFKVTRPMDAAKEKARKELGMSPLPALTARSDPEVDGADVGSKSILRVRPTGPDERAEAAEQQERLAGRLPATPRTQLRSVSAAAATPRPSLGPTPAGAARGAGMRTVSAPLPRTYSPTPSTQSGHPTSVQSSVPTSPPPALPIPIPQNPSETSHELALLLRSAPLNKFLYFPRPFPARPLRVSYAEVGNPDGYPVFFFLGLGCCRYLVALYDEFATAFGLRVICVDRWGYGKTDEVDDIDRGLVEWSTIMGGVCKELGIERYQIVAHSCGAPYALAMARRWPERVRGKVHLLAPWVGQQHESVSKWLKWVPGSVIKTATKADHRLHSLFLGKAPKLSFKPIAFDPKSLTSAGQIAIITQNPTSGAREASGASSHLTLDTKRKEIGTGKLNIRNQHQASSLSLTNTRRSSTVSIKADPTPSSSQSLGTVLIRDSSSAGSLKSPARSSFFRKASSAFSRGPSSIYGSIGAASSVSLALPSPGLPDQTCPTANARPLHSPLHSQSLSGNDDAMEEDMRRSRSGTKYKRDIDPVMERSPGIQDLSLYPITPAGVERGEVDDVELGRGAEIGRHAKRLADLVPSTEGSEKTRFGFRAYAPLTSPNRQQPQRSTDQREGQTSKMTLADLTHMEALRNEFDIGHFESMTTELQFDLPIPFQSRSTLPSSGEKGNPSSMPSIPSSAASRSRQLAPESASESGTGIGMMGIYPSDSGPSIYPSTSLSTSSGISNTRSSLASPLSARSNFAGNSRASPPQSRFPSSPTFALALSQASHAECEPGTTSDIIRVIVNRPYRPMDWLYENIPFKMHIWWGQDDKMVSEKSVRWMQEKCQTGTGTGSSTGTGTRGSAGGGQVELTIKKGVGHGMMSEPDVVGELFAALGAEARGDWS